MSSTSRESHIAQQLIAYFKGLPLWIKQVIYLELFQELSQNFAPESLESLKPDDTIAFFAPMVTHQGDNVILSLKNEIGTLLLDAKENLTVLDICLRHQWSLETCCKLMVEAIRSQWIQPPVSTKALGTIEYLGNSIRLGEYLVKMGRISVEQLDQALRTQQYIKEALQEHTGLANILINLGYITRKDTEGILFLKEESRKHLEAINVFG